MNSRQNNPGSLSNLLTKIDFSRTCFLLMSADGKTVLLDGATGQPWHTYNKMQAINMQKILRDEDKISTQLVTFIEALCKLAALEGVTLTPPWTMRHIQEQLIDAARPKQFHIGFDKDAK